MDLIKIQGAYLSLPALSEDTVTPLLYRTYAIDFYPYQIILFIQSLISFPKLAVEAILRKF